MIIKKFNLNTMKIHNKFLFSHFFFVFSFSSVAKLQLLVEKSGFFFVFTYNFKNYKMKVRS